MLVVIAAGHTQTDQIAQHAGMTVARVKRRLIELENMSVLRQEQPATEPHYRLSPYRRWCIIDQDLHFYYRFLAAQQQGRVDGAWDTIRRQLPKYITESVFKGLCQEWVIREWGTERLPLRPQRVGAFWSQGKSGIDVVAVDEEQRTVLLGACFWTGRPVGQQVVTGLCLKADRVLASLGKGWAARYAFFSRSGFTDNARRTAERRSALLVELDEIDRRLRTADA